MIMKGPKGICEDMFFEFFNKLGTTVSKAITEDRNITKGIASQPNQNPTTAKSLESPKMLEIYSQ